MPRLIAALSIILLISSCKQEVGFRTSPSLATPQVPDSKPPTTPLPPSNKLACQFKTLNLSYRKSYFRNYMSECYIFRTANRVIEKASCGPSSNFTFSVNPDQCTVSIEFQKMCLTARDSSVTLEPCASQDLTQGFEFESIDFDTFKIVSSQGLCLESSSSIEKPILASCRDDQRQIFNLPLIPREDPSALQNLIPPILQVPIETNELVSTRLDKIDTAKAFGVTLNTYDNLEESWTNVQPGAYIEFEINVTKEDNYLLTLYGGTGHNGQEVDVLVDTQKVGSLEIPYTGDLGQFERSRPILVYLKANNKKIRLLTKGDGLPITIRGLRTEHPNLKFTNFNKITKLSRSSTAEIDVTSIADEHRAIFDESSNPTNFLCAKSYCSTAYNLDVSEQGLYSIRLKYASKPINNIFEDSAVDFFVNYTLMGQVQMPFTNGPDDFVSSNKFVVQLEKGIQLLRIQHVALKGHFKLNNIIISPEN